METTACNVVVHGVKKQYSGFTLGPLDLTVQAGSIVGLVGENGAGKTTLLKLITGVNPADEGEILLFGGNPTDPAFRADLGVVFEDAYFSASLTAKQIGNSLAGVFGPRWDKGDYQSYLDRFGLEPGKPLQNYSRGMRMKLSLATALAHHPRLLVLDEATAGLDPVMRSEILDLFLDFIQDDKNSILISSHITGDLEQVADSIAYLHRGQLMFQEDKDQLLTEYGVLHCSRERLEQVPADCRIGTRRTEFGCEVLVKDRARVSRQMPDAPMDPAGIDDIMRFYSGREKE